jgi:hypothetical protein
MERTAPFELLDTDGRPCAIRGASPALVIFAKLDCPTCVASLPLVGAVAEAFGAHGLDVVVVAQDADGGKALRERVGRGVRVLDDSALRVSFAWGIETVPTVALVDPEGAAPRSFVALARADWQALVRDLAVRLGRAEPAIDWASVPELRPGCGSRSLEPGIAERLAAEAEGSPLRARRIAIGASDDVFEFLFDQGLTDGLPVVPPTPERVLRMLSGTKRGAQEVAAIVPPNLAPASVEKVAINAVMAGCRPEHLPVVIAALEAICTDEWNLHGVLATTYFPTPVIIVNGPIRTRLGMNAGMNCLGQGNRANAAIGRAVQLVVRNIGGGRPGEVDRATLGQPGKFTFCFAENEERSAWEPLHVERGFAREQSTVTVYAGSGPVGFIDQLSRSGRSLATSYGLALAAMSHPKFAFLGEVVVIVPPEHVDTFRRDGFGKAEIRARIQEVTARPARELARDAECAEGLPPELVARIGPDTRVAKFRDPNEILLVVAGGEAGKFGAYLQSWVSGPTGSQVVTRAIGE